MKKIGAFRRSCWALGGMIIIFIFSSPGCRNSPATQVTQTLQMPTPTLASVVPSTSLQADILTPSPTSINQAANSSNTATPLPSDFVWRILDQVEKERTLTDLNKLTGEEPICIDTDCYTIKNRLTGSEGLRWAKKYIHEELVNLGYTVELEDWSSSEFSDQNIIARKPGTIVPNEKVYLVAHIDGVKKILPGRYPAADDNASGVVDLLEVARVLSNYSFDRTLVFFFSTGEENGRLGVNSHLQKLSAEELSSIKYVINVDMVGYDGNNDGLMELWHGDDPLSLALTQTMSEIIHSYQLGLSPKLMAGCG